MTTIKCPHQDHQTKIELPFFGKSSLQYCRVCGKPIEAQVTPKGTLIVSAAMITTMGTDIVTECRPEFKQGAATASQMADLSEWVKNKVLDSARLKYLNDELESALKIEDYETAARIRDRIKELQA